MKGFKLAVLIFIIAIVLLFCACELKRNNPLDPSGNPNIQVPNRVVGLIASGSGPGVLSKFVELKWDKNMENTDGYYIYMGLAYNSAYERVGWTSNVTQDSTVTYIYSIPPPNTLAPGFYYFKVSAYKYYGNNISVPDPIEYSSDFLEGSLSEYALARVDN